MAAVDVVKKPVLAPPAPPAAQMNGFHKGIRTVELQGHVGFDSLPDQLVQKAQQQGFTFNLLCVGETGIGKTTLTESLFNMKLDIPPCSNELGTVELRSQTYDIEESKVRLKLTIVETAGFGDQLDKDKSAKVIVDYINAQFEGYLQEELKIRRHLQFAHDTRTHACLYFISPTGHGLKALDITVMRELAPRVNVIPVIAKADTISKDDLKRFKDRISADLKAQGIETYEFPTDDESVADVNRKLNTLTPFAVIGSTDFVSRNGKNVRARQYPWGIVEVENEGHCDFVHLREALLRTNVEDLRMRTHEVLYEGYRRQRLSQMGVKDGDLGVGLRDTYQKKRMENQAAMKAKEEENAERFKRRVKEKEDELKELKNLVQQKHQAQKQEFETAMANVVNEDRRLDEEMAQFERQSAQLIKKAGNKFKG